MDHQSNHGLDNDKTLRFLFVFPFAPEYKLYMVRIINYGLKIIIGNWSLIQTHYI